MADFDNGYWGVYITITTLAAIAGCAVLLTMTSSRRVPTDAGATTGHVWDEDLAEFNNPLPRWWMWLFYLTIAFALVYLILYPGLGAFGGIRGWSALSQYDAEMKAADTRYGPLFQKYLAQPIEQVAADPQARAMGERLFLNTCAQCHGSDARGGRGFPNLTDGDWLYGGTPADIETTIAGGRHGVMPPLAAAIGSPEDVHTLAVYVRSLSGGPVDEKTARIGREKFAVCAACHGAEGKGNTAIGAPNLTDRIWLYGSKVEDIVSAINNGHDNVMPAHKDLLGEAKVHLLAAYVWGLSNLPSGRTAPAK